MISTGSFPKALQGKTKKKENPPPLSQMSNPKGKKKKC